MQLIDTHCHLTFDDLAGDIDAVIERSIAAGVTSWITVGTDPGHNQKAIGLANKYDNMFATVGVHPHDAKEVNDQAIRQLHALAQNKKVVAIGETGLDFHYDHSPRDKQAEVFTSHLHLAAELDLPVIIHSREAFDKTMEILQQSGPDLKKVVFHCFSGSAQQAKIVLDGGFYISFTGVVTFKNAERTRRAAEIVPLDRLMLETDCPYMSPEPMRKQRINEPALMVHTAKFLADLKGMDMPDFAAAVTATSKAFFNLP
ncbi:MAG: YchF/TatD family DNA exonuclease [Phycisphaerae bacterium]|nr:TatD family hydrolase [Phycisphaerae bacterium]NIS50233.1 TatD family hydrolase [Phycisphaerae bacterium]NIU07897.1 TatD family hydrolase [Phycisphaerae bacterium]NIU55499.1 YchF/TatD family DNA exonuclease [Phycisphaerae bacterium]NIU99868.1 YchF/TatD family DNA exonuclease [Phycisphaerae bacterium]